MTTETPIKDAWDARLQTVNADQRFTDIADLRKGDYAMIKTPYAQFFGFIKSVGRVNVVLETPYSPRPGDYICIQDLKFKKKQVKVFAKLKEPK